MSIIYLDNNATTKIAPEVLDAMTPYLTEYYGNPSSMHTFGGQLHKIIEKARGQVAALLNAEPDEIIFTSCGTESNNTAIMSAVESAPEKRHIVTTKVEHPAILNFFRHLERKGFRSSILPVNGDGQLDIEEFDRNINNDTAIVSVMHANNETGVIFPLEAIASKLHKKGILFHTDAVQTAGKIPLDLKKIPVSMLSISGHKLHAPKGIGALYVRKGTPFHPYIIGGHQEHGRRAGTENIASIVGLGVAAELAMKNMDDEFIKLTNLRNRLEHGLLAACPDSRINGDTSNRLPNTVNISFEYIEGEAILLRLNEHGICASSGSACTSGSLEPSHVLKAMNIPHTALHGSVRFSLSRYNTDKDIDAVLEIMPRIVKELRELSPFGRKLEMA